MDIESYFNIKNYSIADFVEVTKQIYDHLGYEYILDDHDIQEITISGAYVWLNPRFENCKVTDIIVMNIELLYPTIMSKIIETNLKHFREVYSIILELYNTTKNKYIKYYLVYAYCALQSKNSPIVGYIGNQAHNMQQCLVKSLKGGFSDSIVYIDTDMIILQNSENIISIFDDYFEHINKCELSYNHRELEYGIFLRRKQYILSDHQDKESRIDRHIPRGHKEKAEIIKSLV